jgi:uncharacterized membrane protein
MIARALETRELSRMHSSAPSLIVDRRDRTCDGAARCTAKRLNHRVERVLITKPHSSRCGRTNETEGAETMSTLVAVVFDDEHTAFAMRAELARMQKELLIELEDAVVVTRDQNGKTKLDQAVNLTSAGALGGGFWGMLIGMIFLNPLLGFALGAGAGALSGKFSDIGLDDKMMKDLAQSFKPGSSALFVIVRRATTDKVLAGLKQFAGKGKVFQTSLNKDDEAALRDALEVGLTTAR